MKTPVAVLLVAVAVAVAAGCGGSSTKHQPTLADVQAYRGLATGVATSAASYGAAAQSDDATACAGRHHAYDDTVRPMVERMRSMSPGMDDMMGGSHGMMDRADLGCGADAMKAELERHAGAACTGDPTANHAEAAHHAQAMGAWASHQESRCGDMEGMMSGGGHGMDDGMGACQPDGSGGYTLGGVHP